MQAASIKALTAKSLCHTKGCPSLTRPMLERTLSLSHEIFAALFRQPMKIERAEGALVWMVNSEIYNHENLRQNELHDVDLSWTSCDSAVVGYLYQKFGPSHKVVDCLDGIFCGVVYDENSKTFVAFRDPIGINSLYWGKAADGAFWFSSEMKAIHDVCESFDVFPPGHIYFSKSDKIERFFKPTWIDPSIIPTEKVDLSRVKVKPSFTPLCEKEAF